jgi:hypothetical protein
MRLPLYLDLEDDELGHTAFGEEEVSEEEDNAATGAG